MGEIRWSSVYRMTMFEGDDEDTVTMVVMVKIGKGVGGDLYYRSMVR